MKKALYSLLIFISIFFVVDKVSALDSGTNYNNFSTNKIELATMYVNNGNSWVSLYGNNGSGSVCGTSSSPELTAPLDCWKNGTLSYVLADTTYGGYYINSLRLFLSEPMKTGKYYKVTINYTINSTSYSSVKDWFQITDYKYLNFSSTCSGVNCKIEFVMRNTATNDLNDLWINFTNSTTTFNTFSSRISKLYSPQVKEVSNVSSLPKGEDVVYFDTKNSNFVSTYKSIKDKLEEVVDYLRNNNPKNHRWVVWLGRDNNGSFVSVNLLPSSFSSFNTTTNYEFCSLTTSKYSNVYYNAAGCSTNSTATKRYTFRSGSSISTLQSDLALSFSNISGTTSGSNIVQHAYLNSFAFTNNEYDYFNGNTYFILPYASTEPIYNYNRSSSGSTFYHIKIGDHELAFDSTTYLEASDKYIDIKDYYEFNEEIDDIEYAKMIFDFDVSVFKERGNIFDYLIQFETIGTIQEDDSLNTNHLQKFSRPYVEYVDRNGLVRRYEVDFGYEDQNSPRSFWWTGNQDEIIGDITSLKLIIPMYETAYARYSIQLTSFIPSTVSYVTNEEDMIYYETIDLSNKYGVVFMPKLVENDSDISSVFYTDAIEQILVYSSYDYSKPPIEMYDSKIDEFSYIITYEQQEYNLFFKVNPEVANLAIVTYDKRYYTYKIVDSKYSMGTLVNPNTNENHYVDFSNTANIKVNFDSIGDIFYFISDKLDDKTDSYILFKDSVNTFFNTMPTDMYVLILTVLAVILIGTALALGGWK